MLLQAVIGGAQPGKPLHIPIVVRTNAAGDARCIAYLNSGPTPVEFEIGLNGPGLGPVRISPDRKGIAFIHNRKLYVAKFSHKVGTRTTTRLSTRVTYDRGAWTGATEVADSVTSTFSYSPDSKKLVFVKAVYSGSTPSRETIWIRESGANRQITTYASVDDKATSPKFSPDGRRIAYYAPSYNGIIKSMAVDGTDMRVENPWGATLAGGGWNAGTWVSNTRLAAPLRFSLDHPTGVYEFGRGGTDPTLVTELPADASGLVRQGTAWYYTKTTRIGTVDVAKAWADFATAAPRILGSPTSPFQEVFADLVQVPVTGP